MGADMWAAEILLRMKEQTAYQDVELCLALPFEGYDAICDPELSRLSTMPKRKDSKSFISIRIRHR